METPLVDGYSVSISNGVISAFVDERDWGVDLSGDGDMRDYVQHYVVPKEVLRNMRGGKNRDRRLLTVS